MEEKTGQSLDLIVAHDILRRHQGSLVSKRDGFVVVKLRQANETWLLWIRSSPVTSNALALWSKLVARHSFDKAFLVKTSDRADYVSYQDLERSGLEVVNLKDIEDLLTAQSSQ